MRDVVIATAVKGTFYKRMLKVLIRSTLNKNRRFRIPWVVMHDSPRQDQIDDLKQEYNQIEFYRVDTKPYIAAGRDKATYWSFEIANPRMDAKKVIYLDCDMICDGPIDAIFKPKGQVCMFKEPKYDQYSAGIIVVNEPTESLYEWLHAQKHREDVNNGGCGTDQNIWNQWPHIEEMHPRDETQRWSVNGYPGPEHPAFWHLIAKPGQSAKKSPPDSGGWKNTHDRVKKLWKVYDGWKPLYQNRVCKERPFWIFCTGRNCEDYVEACIRSVQRQREHFQMVLVDDASTDNTYEIASGLAKHDDRITVVRNAERLYGARSRYEAILSMKTKPDDIVVQLDMDDVLMDGALTRIRLEYREQPDVWMTYGSLVDQTGKQYIAESPSVIDGLSRRRDNMLCLAPRSFRAGLFWMVGQKRLMRGSQWLRCKFDLSATNTMQEMAGSKHIRSIPNVIYKALVNTPRQVWNTMREEERLSHDYVVSQPMRKPIKAYARTKRDANVYLDGIHEAL